LHLRRSGVLVALRGSFRGARAWACAVFAATSILAALCAGSAYGEDARTVVGVEVRGNVLTDSVLVRRTFGIEPGDTLTPTAVSEGIKALFALGFYSDIRAKVRKAGDGWVLVIQVEEWPKIFERKFKGNENIDDDDLAKDSEITVGSIVKGSEIEKERRRIEELYSEKGYPNAVVTPKIKPLPGGRETILIFEIDEGERVRVVDLLFEGNQAFPDDKLRGVVKTKAKSWWRKGYFKEEQLKEDRERLEAFYRKHGYRDAIVEDTRLNYVGEGTEVTITYAINEGRHFVVGHVAVEGNEAVGTDVLMSRVKLEPGREYNGDKLDESLMGLQEIYSDIGYVYATIDPHTAERGDTLDVTFEIEEGVRAHIADVKIKGNTRTREKVIRRELVVRPGDVFSRAALLRSQREVMSLGYFEDVQLSFQPAGPAGDLDVTFEVKEKQVGTAVAGAGFSSDVGLTGFVQLGHNNLFGKGQSVTLHLERGARRSNVEISFTEPWFRDTPTLLGVDVYKMSRERDIFDERRAGGAVRIGRKLT